MTWDAFSLGAAVPGGWSAEAAFRGVEGSLLMGLRSERPRINLLERLGARDWPVRHQGHRGTCNAFAVTAAEELAEALATGQTIRPLSEEALYAEMRGVAATGLSVRPTAQQASAANDHGATFLEQALLVIRQNGLALAGGEAYDSDPLRPAGYHKPVARLAGNGRQQPAAKGYVHDIAQTPDLSGPVVWAKSATDRPAGLRAQFHDALSDNRPVMIALPVFEIPGRDLVLSAHARRFGRIGYPPSETTRHLRPVGGHAVCLVGYEPSDGGPELSGWFVFRNSFGTRDFGAEVSRDASAPRAPAPGYGLIHAWDVERWCWEYLYRA